MTNKVPCTSHDSQVSDVLSLREKPLAQAKQSDKDKQGASMEKQGGD